MELEKQKFKSNYQKRKVEQRQKEVSQKLQKTQEQFDLAKKKNNIILKESNSTDSDFVETDFFGRPIHKAGTKTVQKYSKHSDHSFFFKFQEGHDNAVRRTVYIRDFM